MILFPVGVTSYCVDSNKELKLTSTHFYLTSTLPFNHLVVKYSKTHITSTASTTSTTFGGSGGGGQNLAYINNDTVPH